MLSARDAVALCELLEQRSIHYWVVGGWGVDALLGRETRPHKDLDLLLALGDLPRLWRLLGEHGFTQKWLWEENRWVEIDGDRWPTAFVLADDQGRELDVHVVDVAPDGALVQLYGDHWPLPASISAQGTIDGTVVSCVSREAQLAMHSGYTLPDTHLRDMELLRAIG